MDPNDRPCVTPFRLGRADWNRVKQASTGTFRTAVRSIMWSLRRSIETALSFVGTYRIAFQLDPLLGQVQFRVTPISVLDPRQMQSTFARRSTLKSLGASLIGSDRRHHA
ncbi:MAG: hypothetical protein ABI128_15570 [Rhodanobacter sp.]